MTKFYQFNEHRNDGIKMICPICRDLNQDFVMLSGTLYGCFHCGCVFMPKDAREAMRKELNEGRGGKEGNG